MQGYLFREAGARLYRTLALNLFVASSVGTEYFD
jgi:hypothetical protein